MARKSPYLCLKIDLLAKSDKMHGETVTNATKPRVSLLSLLREPPQQYKKSFYASDDFGEPLGGGVGCFVC
jgi:hypothetical protein